ncbi:hypothetical protein [Ardenticatena maritima]|uniref:hypothetical protein n=1 Tax=Ardenticatena maritima TaxID=872965 RepID=UPI00191BEE4E|nr:hypothetical protein [Ardenticatena maritima]
MLEEIKNYNANKLLNTPIDDLAEYFKKKYWIDVPILHEDKIVADQREVQVDVSRDPMRFIRDRSKPFYIQGTEIEIIIPFEGDAEAFNIQPSTFTLSPPNAEIKGNTIIVRIQGVDLTTENVKSQIDRTISDIKSYLENLRCDVKQFNDSLYSIARSAIEQRREKLLKDQSLVAGLGFPLKERADATKTYVAPEVRRKIIPSPPVASSDPYKPEPVLDLEHYEHILNVIENMALVMERSPSAFVDMDEESLRTHFLVQLNGHFEGSATGETFNYMGKTDILIRVNGKNIFIAECKFWGGPKKLTETIDQILSYSSWRDTKVAIIIFNKNKNFSAVLDAIPNTIEEHPNYKRSISQVSDTGFRYVMSHRNDPSREMLLTVLVFDVPKQP